LTEKVQLPYYEKELARTEITDTTEYKQSVVELLSDDRIIEAAKSGHLTLAMIRPFVGPDANLQGLSDAECADLIEEMIEGLGVAGKFSFRFTEDVVGEFYEGAPQEVMEKNPPLDATRFDSRWPEFKEFMSSGTTTALLLYAKDGDAIERWRAHLGHWNIDKYRDPATIRGALGVNLYNNLVHGSDAPESVVRELGLIRSVVES
tara:strand:- start:31 stop:645 length:615 start_codon:yes stop_codon:yes gene_type:complete